MLLAAWGARKAMSAGCEHAARGTGYPPRVAPRPCSMIMARARGLPAARRRSEPVRPHATPFSDLPSPVATCRNATAIQKGARWSRPCGFVIVFCAGSSPAVYAATASATGSVDLDSSISTLILTWSPTSQPAGLERHVPVQAEVLAVEGALGRQAPDFAAPRVLVLALARDVERELAGHALDRQVADHLVLVAARPSRSAC